MGKITFSSILNSYMKEEVKEDVQLIDCSLAQELGRYGVLKRLFLAEIQYTFETLVRVGNNFQTSVQLKSKLVTLFQLKNNDFLILDELEEGSTRTLLSEYPEYKVVTLYPIENYISNQYEVDPIIQRTVNMENEIIYQKCLDLTRPIYKQVKHKNR